MYRVIAMLATLNHILVNYMLLVPNRSNARAQNNCETFDLS